ncbi:MAG TPA: ABC transporter substrate-binding protein [Pseudolabrys sp.]|nr:ABC transporter substrate-binding protein [Pseudolabrys sp.]
MKRCLATLVLSVCAVALSLPAAAQELRIGLASEPTSIDPHFHDLGPNNSMRHHIFEGLTTQNAEQKVSPELAVSWRALDDTTWEFKLRPNVKFSNGMAFSAKDVVYTICRIPTVENSPSSMSPAVSAFVGVETPDPLTVVIKTNGPQPLVPSNLAGIGILSAEINGGKDVRFKQGGCENLGKPPQAPDFNDPAHEVGTGPFKLVNYTRGQQIILARNDSYWGGPSHWKQVMFRPMANAAARVAALIAGDVDMIENPPIPDFDRLKGAGFTISEGLSNRVIYIHLDQNKDPAWKTPGVRGTDGKNPFLDKRVREAVSIAINRKAIDDRIMGGHAVPAGELLPYPLFGATKDFPVAKYDPERAKKLLAEAGYPNGFEVTLGTPNDRYINDEKIAQAVAQMLTRVGIKTQVDASTASTFFTKRNKFEFSMYLAGWSPDSGEMSNSLNSLVVTLQPDKGRGTTNRGRYSNPALDELVIKAKATVDDAAREKLLQQASKLVIEDYGIIPLHFEVTPWAMRKGLSYKPRVDQFTIASDVKETGK